MSQFWLTFVPPASASGRLKEVYERVINGLGVKPGLEKVGFYENE